MLIFDLFIIDGMSRDNFKESVKKILGSRVAFRCCFPGCGILTIGPRLDSPGVLSTGEAAHIHAASVGGPRYKESMTTAERCSQENGIWLCRAHARMIDADEGSYSAETIRQWKTKAESETYRHLKDLTKINLPDPSTLVCLNSELIFEGVWIKASGDSWTFAVKEMIYGDILTLKEYRLDNNYKNYLIIESQGDGRFIHNIEWTQEGENILITAEVSPSVVRRNPENIGTAPAMGENMLENGRWRLISGRELAIQKIEVILNTPVGSQYMNSGYGSQLNKYINDHSHNLNLLNRLIKIELTRLITTPTNPEMPNEQPELNFINRINEVSLNIENKESALLTLSLEWGDGTSYNGTFHVFLDHRRTDIAPKIKVLKDEKISIPVIQDLHKKLNHLTTKFSGPEIKEKANVKAITKIFLEVLPSIMKMAEISLMSEIYPLFYEHKLFLFFDNISIDYASTIDFEHHLLQHGLIKNMGVTIKLDGFKKAGVKAFDITSDLAFHFEDYFYTIGPLMSQPWFTKLYDQLPNATEITQITQYFINDLVKRINELIESIR